MRNPKVKVLAELHYLGRILHTERGLQGWRLAQGRTGIALQAGERPEVMQKREYQLRLKTWRSLSD